MKAASRLRAPILAACGLASLIAAAGCTFDASKLRASASPAPDGAVEPDAGASGSGGTTTSQQDAATTTGGNGGSVGTGGSSSPGGTSEVGGSSSAGARDAGLAGAGGSSGVDAGVGGTGSTAPLGGTAGADAGVAGSGGGGNGGQIDGGGGGGTGAVGGTARADAGVAGSGGGGNGGTAGRTANGGATGGTGGIGGASSYGGTTSPSTTSTLPNSLEVYLTMRATGSTNGQISLDLRIDNQTTASVDLSTVTLRYWYQDDGWNTTTLTIEVDYRSDTRDSVTGGKAVAAPRPTAGADHYLELSFTGTLAAKGQFATNVRVRNNWQGTVDVTNDYSYNGGASGYDSKITLYQSGKLIWGVEP